MKPGIRNILLFVLAALLVYCVGMFVLNTIIDAVRYDTDPASPWEVMDTISE